MPRIDRFTGPVTVRLAAVLTLLAVFAALVMPPAVADEAADTWLVPASEGVPDDAELVSELPIADALLVRGDPPPGAATLDTELSWQSDEVAAAGATDGSPYEEPFVDPAVTAVRDGLEDQKAGAHTPVALIDTGVASVPGLEGAVATEVNFTGEEQGGDGYGHGTYMASLIAASGDLAPGVAPDAGLVSLKVADADGTTTLGQVLGAMQWLEGPGRSLGIRVASLSLGVDADSPAGHLLDMAVDHLAATGVLVVTAAGNEGPGNLSSPATAPGSLAVGALDGDETAEFSADGTDRAGESQPSIFAPGVDVVGHLAPGSVIAAALAEDAEEGSLRQHRLDRGLLQGSGTSAATALATGVAAVVSGEYPELDGADLATAMLSGGDPLSASNQLSASDALAAAADLEPSRPVADLDVRERPGNAPEHSNAPGTLPSGSNGKGNGPNNLADLPLPPVAAWDPAEWNEAAKGWTTGSDWAVARWHVARWHEASWSVARWHVARWHVARWHADDWSAQTWDAAHWDVARWHADDWDVARWHVARWHVARWHADDWHVARWHVARWHADDWDVARWHVARWHADDWSVARWHADNWDVARWHVAQWTLIAEL